MARTEFPFLVQVAFAVAGLDASPEIQPFNWPVIACFLIRTPPSFLFRL